MKVRALTAAREPTWRVGVVFTYPFRISVDIRLPGAGEIFTVHAHDDEGGDHLEQAYREVEPRPGPHGLEIGPFFGDDNVLAPVDVFKAPEHVGWLVGWRLF